MCTAITCHSRDHYFGRTLDLEYTYHETVTVMPRRYPLRLRCGQVIDRHPAMIGMATVENGYPLYYEAANECGLCAAGLNFPGLAHYFPPSEDKQNITPFELIPWLLCSCENLAQARTRLGEIRLWDCSFSDELPLSPLHWMIADRSGALTVECVREGLRVIENPVGVLTNNPGFDYHMTRLNDFLNLTAQPAHNRFDGALLTPYSRGMGAIGLPGDGSSSSRFVRAAFVKLHSISEEGEKESVGQFFHLLGAVEQPRGSVRLEDGRCVITAYTSCINADKGVYYYTTYGNRCISAVDMHRCNLDSDVLSAYALADEQVIRRQN